MIRVRLAGRSGPCLPLTNQGLRRVSRPAASQQRGFANLAPAAAARGRRSTADRPAPLKRCVGARSGFTGTYFRRCASTAPATLQLPDDFQERYQKDGFVIVPDLLSKDQVSTLLEEMEAICRGQRGPIPGVQPVDGDGLTREEVIKNYLCIHFPHKVSSVIQELTREANTVAVLQALLGENVKCMQTMMFMKGAGKPGQACHQDEFYIPTRDRSLCASWIALDDATLRNGCIWVIPGSHQPGIIWPMRPHRDERFDFADVSYGHGYSDEDFISVELPSGSAVFFNGYLLHRSLPNNSNGFRRAFANHYMRAESLLPWTNDGRFDIKDDMRDFLLVSGADPYADFKPMQDFTKPFVRGESTPSK